MDPFFSSSYSSVFHALRSKMNFSRGPQLHSQNLKINNPSPVGPTKITELRSINDPSRFLPHQSIKHSRTALQTPEGRQPGHQAFSFNSASISLQYILVQGGMRIKASLCLSPRDGLWAPVSIRDSFPETQRRHFPQAPRNSIT